jgi:MscS family membrane protein
MSYGASDQNRRNWRSGSYRLAVALALFLFVSSSAHSQAHTTAHAAPPPVKAEPAPSDPLGRGTPRSTIMGLAKCIEHEDYENSARYLQPTPGHPLDLVELAKELQSLRRTYKGNILLLSDDPSGTVEPGLPPGQARAGVAAAGNVTVDVILVRVDDPVSGKIWLVSKETVARIPELYSQKANVAPAVADRIMPAALTGRRLLGMSLAQWLGWLFSIPISFLLAWLLVLILTAPMRIRSRFRGLPFTPLLGTGVRTPLKCIVAILLHSFLVYLLEPPLLYRVYYVRFIGILLMGCIVWLVAAITDRGFDSAVSRTRTMHKGGESILILLQRLTRILLLIVALVAALAISGLNVTTTLAGLGIGGLAIALAAQRTLENIIGGISLLLDGAVHVGDFCRIGDQLGTVEDIGLRSLKLRTREQNLLVVPNGSLAQMQFENMTGRSKLLINQTFALRIETEVEQLRFVLDGVQTMLDQHPAIEPKTSRVRVINFVGAAFAVELFAYVKTGDWAEFTAIRQDVTLKIAEIVEASGARFAAPTQLTYLSRDAGVDPEKARDIVRHVSELRDREVFKFPGEIRTGTE